MAQVRAGESAAFEAIYDRYARGLLAFCMHMLGNREAAEDALQLTFVSAYRALGIGDVDDADLQHALRLPRTIPMPGEGDASAVAATAEALDALLREGRPEFREQPWVPHRPPRIIMRIDRHANARGRLRKQPRILRRHRWKQQRHSLHPKEPYLFGASHSGS